MLCDTCVNAGTASYKYPCNRCDMIEGSSRCEYKKVRTHADRIRAMSDEELAKWIDDMYCQCVWCDIKKVDCNDAECTDCIVAWLQQPTEVY